MSKPFSPLEIQRLNDLRSRAHLDVQESAELNELLARADVREAELLAPSTRELEATNRARESENQRLAGLVERRQHLANQLAESLQVARSERGAIELELQSILQASTGNASELAEAKR